MDQHCQHCADAGQGSPATFFAPPERDPPESLDEMSRFVQKSPLFQAIIDSVDGYLMVLNPQRQVLAVNQGLLDQLNLETPDSLVGERPGEVLSCIHVPDGPNGCGTSKACATCGAVISILTSQNQDRPVEGECLATVSVNDHTEAAEFSVRSTPVKIGGQIYTIFTLHDISGLKRREALERTFFHDILNTIGGLMGYSSLLTDFETGDPKEIAQRIVEISMRLKQEVEDQRRLSLAENGALTPEWQPTAPGMMLEQIGVIFKKHDAARNKCIVIHPAPTDNYLVTDQTLLLRILINMTKNALEASKDGENVELRYERRPDGHAFMVSNPGSIPESVAQQIFQRSFSTKSNYGRGIGTYSMKLFGERYLKGRVGFTTSEEDNATTFYAVLPDREFIPFSK